MKHIPNLFTLLNLVAGCLAILFALQTNAVNIYVNDGFTSSFNIPERLTWAGFCIVAAALIDFLDGFLARLLRAVSPLGKQLDSLSDTVSFGVAPAMILYQLLRFSYAREENGLDISIGWLLPAFLIAVAAAYRLAVFNLDESQATVFRGVPVPAAGLLIASFPLILHFNPSGPVNDLVINKWFLYGVIAVVSLLMVSRLRMMSLKPAGRSLRENGPAIGLLVLSIVAGLFLQWAAVPVIFVAYVLISIFTLK